MRLAGGCFPKTVLMVTGVLPMEAVVVPFAAAVAAVVAAPAAAPVVVPAVAKTLSASEAILEPEAAFEPVLAALAALEAETETETEAEAEHQDAVAPEGHPHEVSEFDPDLPSEA